MSHRATQDEEGYAATYLDGKGAQVEALNRVGVSLDQYRWTRVRGARVPLVDLDLSRIVANAQGTGRSRSAAPAYASSGSTASPVVKALVEPHRGVLERNAALAAYGL